MGNDTLSVLGSFIFLNGSELTYNNGSATIDIIGEGKFFNPENGMVTVKTNSNDGFDVILDGEVTITNLAWYAKDTITVNDGAEITVKSMAFNGTITNNGTMNLSGSVKIHDSKAELINNGKIVSDANIAIDNVDGQLVNNGELNLKTGTIANNGTIENNGTILNYAGADLGTVEGTVPSATVDENNNLILTNYNGSDVFDGSYAGVVLVGDNTITLEEEVNAITLADGAKIYSVEGTGSLTIVMDVTKATGDVKAIDGAGVIIIDGITLNIDITAGANPTYDSVIGINSDGLKTFASKVTVNACVTDYLKDVEGIKAGSAEVKNSTIDSTAGKIAIESTGDIEIANSKVTVSASENAIVATTITATIGSEIDAEAQGYDATKSAYAIVGELNTASDSIVTASSMKITGGENNATVNNDGNMVITGDYTNKATFVNNGTVNVTGGTFTNAAGTVTNNGAMTISAIKGINGTLSENNKITGMTGTTTANAYVSDVTFTKVEILANGTALVGMTLTFTSSDRTPVEVPATGIATLDGVNLLGLTTTYRQVIDGSTVAQGTISISKTTIPNATEKAWQVTTSGTIKFDGENKATSASNTYKETTPLNEVVLATASDVSLAVSGGELVNNGKLAINNVSDKLVNGGKLTNNSDMTVSAGIAVANGALSGDFTVSKSVVIKIGIKGSVDSIVTYNGTYTPAPTTENSNPASVSFTSVIDVNVIGKTAGMTIAAVQDLDTAAGCMVIADLDKLADDSKIKASAGITKIEGQTIPDKFVLEVLEGATLNVVGENTVNGVVAAQNGSTVNMMVDGNPATYTFGTLVYVISFQKDGYTYYCNLAYALSNVEEGMTLTVNAETAINDDVVVKKNVTLNIAANVPVTIKTEKKVTMEEGASFVLNKGATLILENDSVITGTVKYKENSVVFSNAKVVGTIGTQDAATSVPEAVTLTGMTVKDGTVTASAGNVDGALTIAKDENKVGSFVVDKDAASYVEYKDVEEATAMINGTMYVEDAMTIEGKVTGDGSIIIKDGKSIVFQDRAVADIMIGNGTVGFDMNGVSAVDITKKDATGASFTLNAVAKTTTADAYVTLGGTVFAGEMNVIGAAAISGLIILENAVVIVPSDATLTVTGTESTATGLVKVAGTINMRVTDDSTTAKYGVLDYEITYTDGGYTVYTMVATAVKNANPGDSFTLSEDLTITDENKLEVPSGVTIVVPEDYKIILDDAYLLIGSPITTIGATGGIDGTVVLKGEAYVVEYADASMDNSKMKITGETSAIVIKNSQVTVLNNVYATVYAIESAVEISKVTDKITPEIDGYRFVKFTDVVNGSITGKKVGETDIVANMMASQVQVVFEKVDGITYYVNNQKMNTVGAPVYVAYGSTVTAVADYGYTGTPLVNGQAYVIIDSTTTTIVGSGVTAASSAGSSSSDDGMGITDYLLIVLVVLIVIMAVLVAIRMMRS